MYMNNNPKNEKWKEWCKKDEDEQAKIAEENEWGWYFEWGTTGDILRAKYEKADPDPKPANKYGGYDQYYAEHEIGKSYVYLGMDASFHHSDKPTNVWTEFTPCTNTKCSWHKDDEKAGNCRYYGERPRLFECFEELFATIQSFIDVCGIENIDELQKDLNIHPDIIGWFKEGDEYFNKGDDNMAKNMKYILEEGIIENGQKKCQKSDQGHDAGAVLLNQNNCKKFDLIDDALTHQNNKIAHDNLSTTFTGISYIKVKQYSPKDDHTYTSALTGNIIIERDGHEFAVIKGDAAIKGGKTFLFLVDNVVEIEIRYKDNYYKHLKCWGLIDNTDGYMVIYDPINKNEEGGKIYLNDNAVKEITDLLNKVKEVVDFVRDLGIIYQSDSWNATMPSDYNYENILTWTEEHFKHIDITNIDCFIFGGSVCDHEHKWKGKYVTGPKDLHQAKVNVVKKYVQKIVDNFKPQYFEIGNVNAEDIYDNCGWECNVDFVVTPIKPKCLEKSINQELIDQIKKEISIDYEYDEKECNAETGIKPEGYFAYMLEHFSDLVDPNDVEYEGNFGYNGKYIRDVMKVINKTEEKAKFLREKYEKYGVKVTIGDFNVGCEFGVTIYIWIPYQTQKRDESNKPYYH